MRNRLTPPLTNTNKFNKLIEFRQLSVAALAVASTIFSGPVLATYSCTNQDGETCPASTDNLNLIYSTGSDLSDRKITLTGELPTSFNIVMAAYNTAGNTSGNSVVLDGVIATPVYLSGDRLLGAQQLGDGEASKNSLEIRNHSVVRRYALIGAQVDAGIEKAASDNQVKISDSEVYLGEPGQFFIPGVMGALHLGTGAVTGNSVTISNSTVTGTGGNFEWIMGAFSNGAGDASGNAVTISKSTVTNISPYGILGAMSDGNTNGNTVQITDSEINASFIFGATSDGGTANGNTVILNKVTATNTFVYAGNASSGAANSNLVRLVGESSTVKALVGGNGATHTGNRLEVSSFGNVASAGIGNFDSIEFNVPGSSDKSMLTLTAADAGDISDVKSVKTSLKSGGGFAKGDRINLITCAECTLTLSPDLEKTKGNDYTEDAEHVITEGVSLAWNFDYGEDDKNLYITIGDSTDPGTDPDQPLEPVDPNPDQPVGPVNPKPDNKPAGLRSQTKSLVETPLAAAVLLRQGSDLLARAGLEAMENALEAPYTGPKSLTPFVAVGGTKLHHQTSSHVTVKGSEAVVGLAAETANRFGKFIAAPIVEYGRGDYDSYLDNGIHGDGTSEYWGAGVAMRQNFEAGYYFDASLRYGRIESDYASSDLDGAPRLKYDLHTNYLALHAAAGKSFSIAANQQATVYGKYFYDRQKAASTTLSSGEAYRFSSVDGHRVQIGGKYAYGFKEHQSVYADLLWQYEFKTEAAATYKGLSTPYASMKGSSGSLALGWHKEAAAESPWFADVQAGAWAGKQRHFTAQLIAGYKF